MRALSRVSCALAAALSLVASSACDSRSPAEGEDAGADATAPDAALPDAPVHRGPLAKVYRASPTEDQQQTVDVKLEHLTDAEGRLTGSFARVFNCLNTDGGDVIKVELGGLTINGKVCKVEQVARAGADGSYLHIEPAAESDGDDSFAELMMYHHVSTIHDYFKDVLGVQHMDHPLRALVNVQAYVDLLGRWLGIVNAAFVPKETGTFLKSFGVDLNKGEDAIIFFQGDDVDTAYDATVIYHEYTHAIIGKTLFGHAHDQYGLDPTPGALNEALADYFAASFLDLPVVGRHALGSLNGQRDLQRTFKCPDHFVGEVHQDGEVAGGALWKLRTLLTRPIADAVIMNAVLGFTAGTTFEEGAKAILDEVQTVAPQQVADAQAIFEQHGMLGCDRVQTYQEIAGGPIGPRYAGKNEVSALFSAGVPSFLQYRLAIAESTKEIVIEYVPQSGAGPLGMLPGPKGDVAVALRRGSEAITYDYSSGQAVSSAHLIAKGADDGAGYKLVLAGSCITTGDIVLQLVNLGATGGQITKLKITQSDTVSGAATSFDQCP